MSAGEGLKITLPARSENVAVVRHAVAGLAEALGMTEQRVADLKTVVGEACMNVVLHAYAEEGAGPLEVVADPEEGALLITVRDFGTGIRPRADVDRASLRLGLPLIAALSSSFEVRGGLGQGTEVTMRMGLGSEAVDAEPDPAPPQLETSSETEVSVGNDHVGQVVSRVISMLAARSDFSVDRVSDAMLIGDAIAASAPQGFADGRVHLLIADREGSVDLRVGPMFDGAGERLRSDLAVPEIDASIERLAEDVVVEDDEKGEYLSLRVRPEAP